MSPWAAACTSMFTRFPAGWIIASRKRPRRAMWNMPPPIPQFAADGVLARLTGVAGAMVNSLHHQGIDRLAPGLKAEATAPDGLIEAVSMPGASGLVLGVQWHPEWRWAEDRVNRALFAAFGQAIRTAR